MVPKNKGKLVNDRREQIKLLVYLNSPRELSSIVLFECGSCFLIVMVTQNPAITVLWPSLLSPHQHQHHHRDTVMGLSHKVINIRNKHSLGTDG